MIKKVLLIGTIITTLSSCGTYVRIGDLTGVSNRNIDNNQQYVLVARDVQAITKSETDAFEQAVDNLTKDHQGEFLRNVKIYVKSNGKKVKVVGDVWGIQNTSVNVTANATAEIELQVGDSVVFTRKGKIVDGKILGLNPNSVIVEYGKWNKRVELKYDKVTKTK